jgi:hypothetical protein
MFSWSTIITPCWASFKGLICLQLVAAAVLSHWQEYAERQSRIMLSLGTNNPLVWLQSYSKCSWLLLYYAKSVTLPYRLIMLASCRPHPPRSSSLWLQSICGSNRFLDPGVLLSHMRSKHLGQSCRGCNQFWIQCLVRKHCRVIVIWVGYLLLEIQARKMWSSSTRGARHSIKWLFYAPSSEIGSKPFLEVWEFKRQQGNMVLESIKKKKKTLRANKYTTEV